MMTDRYPLVHRTCDACKLARRQARNRKRAALCKAERHAAKQGMRAAMPAVNLRAGRNAVCCREGAPVGSDAFDRRFYYLFTTRRQCSHAARIKFSLASGVRNAECADSVTFSSFVSG